MDKDWGVIGDFDDLDDVCIVETERWFDLYIGLLIVRKLLARKHYELAHCQIVKLCQLCRCESSFPLRRAPLKEDPLYDRWHDLVVLTQGVTDYLRENNWESAKMMLGQTLKLVCKCCKGTLNAHGFSTDGKKWFE